MTANLLALGAIGLWSTLATLCPVLIFSGALALWPPQGCYVWRVGWAMAACSLATAALLLLTV